MSGPCIVVITAGQSNSAGRGTDALAPTAVEGYEFRDDALIPLAEPVGGVDPYKSNTGSMWPAFSNALHASTGLPIIIVPTAVGGTGLLAATATSGGWWDGGNRRTACLNRASAALTWLDGEGWEPEHVIVAWHQGESDAQNYPTQETLEADYEDGLVDLFDALVAGIHPDLRMFVWQLGTRPGYEDGYTAVRNAQASAAVATTGIDVVYSRCREFFDLGWMKPDNLHYTQDGLNDMGTAGGYAIASLLGYDVPVTPTPLGPPSSLVARKLLMLPSD